MIEIPEAATLARQLNKTAKGKRIASARAGQSPYKFAWYTGDPGEYGAWLEGRIIAAARASGGIVELATEGGPTLFFSDGTNLRHHGPGAKLPEKHQLLLTLDDGGALTGSVRMYGALLCYPDAAVDNGYITGSRRKPSPLTGDFDREYFDGLIRNERERGLSAKAFLATEQRIPGLGNGVLQDILFNAGLHPRRKMDTLSGEETDRLYRCVRDTLKDMTDRGGRDTEADLFGLPGGYTTILSRNTLGAPCPRCGGAIVREAYLGGNVYSCRECQPI